MEELWANSRGGSHAGRGFHYQDAVATELALRAWSGEFHLLRLIPEGLEDVSLELDTHWLHVQAKSRRQHRGDFNVGELGEAWRHLAERLVADRRAHAALVLERPLPGAETGFESTLADIAEKEVKRDVASAVGSVIDAADFLARTHVCVLPADASAAVTLLAAKLGIAPGTCVAHYEILGAKIAALADENGVRESADAAALTMGEVGRIINDVSEAVDASALEEAERNGVCELVDFATPVEDSRFYSGVDVVAGHIVAGLPLARPALTSALAEGLFARRVALAVAPSGAGKSALIWLTAYETRHLVRWYRVSRLAPGDVPALVRLVKGLRPTGATVGFVVDDLGRDDRLGFDQLVEALREQPDTLLLGACREEDLFVLRTARQAAQVRPRLEEELAERIWRELRETGETGWEEWREPYEQSEALLLEYGHLLTEGTRLEETVGAQVARRLVEKRTLELEVLGLVATADSFGAELDVTRVAAALGAESTAMRGALERLVDEHLIRERDGVLGGLHELRSRYVMREIHHLPPPRLTDTVRRIIDLVDAPALQTFLIRLLLEQAVGDEVAVDAAAARIIRDPDPRSLAGALQALRLVGFKRMTEDWLPIFIEEDAAPTTVGLITHLALHGGDSDFFPEPLQNAVDRIRALEYSDLRVPLLERVADHVPHAIANAASIETAAVVLAALGEVGRTVAVDANHLARLAAGTDLSAVRLLLEAAYAASPELAIEVAEALGGSAGLVSRLESERPWLRRAQLASDDDGRLTASADYAYVAETAQPDAHATVVELARYLAALAPAAKVAVARAVDATGETAGLEGVPIADKRIDRRNLPSQAEVAWNRARGRAALAAVAATTETEYALVSREVVARAADVIRRAGDAWARGKQSPPGLYRDAVALAEIAHRMRPQPIAVETVGPLDEGDLPLLDPASFVGETIANQIYVGLFQGDRVAPLITQLLEQVDELAASEHWRFLNEAPLQDVARLRQTLLDVHAVAAERASGDSISAAALSAAGRNGLAAAANVARHRAGQRMVTRVDLLANALAASGFSARVLTRAGEPESHRWPSDDFLVLVDVPSIFAWQRHLEALTDVCRPLLQDRVGFFMAPVRDGRIVGSYGVRVFDRAFPDESVREWTDLPLPLLQEQVYLECGVGLSGLAEASGVIASVARPEVHDEEADVVERSMKRANETLRFFEALAEETGDELILEVGGEFLDLVRRVEAEAAGLADGKPVARGVAASFIHGLKGEPDELFAIYVGMLGCCIEWDIDPQGAWGRFQQRSKAVRRSTPLRQPILRSYDPGQVLRSRNSASGVLLERKTWRRLSAIRPTTQITSSVYAQPRRMSTT